MRKILTILALLIAIGILSWGAYSYLSVKAKTQPLETETTLIKQSKYDNINVKAIERRENEDRSLLNVAYPVTENSDINQAVEDLAQEFINSFTEMASSQEQAYKKYLADTGIKSNSTVTDYTQHFDVSFANDKYVSFIFYQYQSTGGTGMSATFAKIFNRQTGVEIPIKDLFTDPSYLERLSKISRETLIARVLETVKTLDGTEQALADYVLNNKKSITEGTKPVPENFDSLVISDDGILTIYFDKYQVGPGSSGIVSVEVPLEQIADILAPEVRDIFSVPKPELETEETVVIDTSPQIKPSVNLSGKINCAVVKCVALTFDDGPSVYTGTLLDTLKEYNVPATFFVLGLSVKIQPDTITRIVAEGHELGNHTWDHKDLRTLSGTDIDMQLHQTDELLNSIVGIRPLYLRPPYGAYNDEVLAHIDRPIILWSVDPEDWKEPPRAELIKRMTSPQSGAIILAHDIHQPTVAAIPEVISELRRQGFIFVTVSELLHRPLEAGQTYRHR